MAQTIEEQYQKVLQQTQMLQREVDRAKGAVDVLKKEIRGELGCDSMADVKVKMAELEEEMESAGAEYAEALERRKRFHDKLREME